MISLSPTIARIKALLDEDTEASVTYAALEARMALERVVYDRLRQRHYYISHAQLRRWKPGAVVNTLIAEVDAHLGETMTLYISKEPAVPGETPKDEDFVPVGTEVGFDRKHIAKMWQALANLALHVRLPEHRDDHIPDYGDKAQIRAKVDEVVRELERLAVGTMTFSGVPVGGDVSFVCQCGEKNKRRALLLTQDQRVFCFNPDCKATWKVRKHEEEIWFEEETCDFICQGCGKAQHLPWRLFYEMRFDQRATFVCNSCDHRNYVEWRLMQVAPVVSASEQPEEAGAP